MDKKEFMLRVSELQEKQEALLKELSDLQAEYINSLGFKCGDRVRVTKRVWTLDGEKKESPVECFIGNIRIARFSDSRVDYDFRAIKKDGTMSKSTAGIYSHYEVEIEKV